MDIDHELQARTTPPGTPFDEDFTETASRGAPTVTPPAGVTTKNFYTPLYTESQSTGHPNRTAAYTTQIRVAQLERVEATQTKAEIATTTTEAAAQATENRRG